MQSHLYVSNFCYALRQMSIDTNSVCSAVVESDEDLDQLDVIPARELYESDRQKIIDEDQETIAGFISYLLSYNKHLVQTFLIDSQHNDMKWEEILAEDFDGNLITADK